MIGFTKKRMHVTLHGHDYNNMVPPQLISCLAACWDILSKRNHDFSASGKLVADQLWSSWFVAEPREAQSWHHQLRRIGESCGFNLLSRNPSRVDKLWKCTVAVFGHEIDDLLEDTSEFLAVFDQFCPTEIYAPAIDCILSFDCSELENETTSITEKRKIISTLRSICCERN